MVIYQTSKTIQRRRKTQHHIAQLVQSEWEFAKRPADVEFEFILDRNLSPHLTGRGECEKHPSPVPRFRIVQKQRRGTCRFLRTLPGVNLTPFVKIGVIGRIFLLY